MIQYTRRGIGFINRYHSSVLIFGEARTCSGDSVGGCYTGSLKAYFLEKKLT